MSSDPKAPTMEQLEVVRKRWGLNGAFRFIRRVANFVYESSWRDQAVIVRLTEPKRRTLLQIQSELDWIDFLVRQGMQVAGPVGSIDGSLAETIHGAESFHVSVFNKAKGVRPSAASDFSSEMLESWGQYIGRMQRLTLEYNPPLALAHRPQWENDDALLQAMRCFDSAPTLAQERMSELLQWLRQLPQPKAAFGLIHADLHHGNFLVEDGVMTAFDFDDSCHHWFVYDLTPAIFSMLTDSADKGLGLTYDTVTPPFLRGYSKEYSLDEIWVKRLPIFLKFRTMLLYHWMRTGIVEGLFDQRGKEWCEARLASCLKEVEPPLCLF